MNYLIIACNQKTSRDPVVQYSTDTVEAAIQGLKEKGFLRTVSGAEHRVPKYKHDLPFILRLNPAQTAVLTVLMLRGPQTVGEIRSRTDRLYEFASLEVVADTLRDLMDHLGRKLVTELGRLPGTKEPRFAHCLCGEVDLSLYTAEVKDEPRESIGSTAQLREDLEALRDEFNALRDEFARFRQQFE